MSSLELEDREDTFNTQPYTRYIIAYFWIAKIVVLLASIYFAAIAIPNIKSGKIWAITWDNSWTPKTLGY